MTSGDDPGPLATIRRIGLDGYFFDSEKLNDEYRAILTMSKNKIVRINFLWHIYFSYSFVKFLIYIKAYIFTKKN
jgi:hypothetical protein